MNAYDENSIPAPVNLGRFQYTGRQNCARSRLLWNGFRYSGNRVPLDSRLAHRIGQADSLFGDDVMIDVIRVWKPQVSRYAQTIVRQEELRRCWVNGHCEHTSVISFDELYEQVFGDLDSRIMIEIAQYEPSLSDAIKLALREFIDSLESANLIESVNNSICNVEKLLNSPSWRRVYSAASNLIEIDGRL